MDINKSVMICNICKMVLSDSPISLPCTHAVCAEHLQQIEGDGTGSIRCEDCEKKYDLSSNLFPTHIMASNILAKNMHLSDQEKKLKQSIQATIQQLEQLLSDLKLKHSDLERISSGHFSEVKRQIDIQRERLKNKIDEIALKMIDQVNEREKAFNSETKQSLLAATPENIAESRRIWANAFRNPNIIIGEVKKLQTEHEQKRDELQAKLLELDYFIEDIKTVGFEAVPDIQIESFGQLILNKSKTKSSVACAIGNTIHIWNLDPIGCVNTLVGHSKPIACLENIDKNRFASGSDDTTIKIWDAKKFVCLKTLTGHHDVVLSIKSLASGRLATGTFKMIKIWSIVTGECLQTLNGHSDWINGLVSLPNGNLVSCSNDKTIKMWDLNIGECIQTLTDHTYPVLCLVLLKNGQLASGSEDKTIKIWNIENGKCVHTLQSHSFKFYKLRALQSGELISCSEDNSIKIWNLMENTCLRTLNGLTAYVSSVRVNSQNNTLTSSSWDGTLKTWNLNTGECVNTIVVQNDAKLSDFVFI